jgi:uncharacterized membrane protein HdeD (DUF308 family)
LFGLVLILVGALMTAHNLGLATLDLRHGWPVFVILAGVAIVLRGVMPHSHPRRHFRRRFESSTIESSDKVTVDAARFGGSAR